MAIDANPEAVEFARQLIEDGRYVLDKHGDWDQVNPDTNEQDNFVREHGMKAYGNWHLGVKVGGSYNEKSVYSSPYGDFHKVYRSGLIAAQERAAQYHHGAVEQAAKDLLAMLPEGE